MKVSVLAEQVTLLLSAGNTPLKVHAFCVAAVVPSYTLSFAVTVAVTATLLTVRVAAFEVAVCVPLQVFVNTARYWLPLALSDGVVTVSVVLVAPEIFVHVEPLLVLTCH